MQKLDLPINKKALRRHLLKMRRSMTVTEWREKSDRLCTNLQKSLLFNQAQTILAYFSLHQEPDLSVLLTNSQKRWGFPRCVDKSLHWHYWQPEEPLHKGAYDILEPSPTAKIVDVEEVDLILVPCVACDVQGFRLGYGGGYYDRLLSHPHWINKPTIGVVFDFAYFTQLPVEPWDIPLKAVVTDGINSGKPLNLSEIN
ncbi:5-formyltetrahydrofolate cyclo-ligase [Richelia sinica FACHB-800]|uniref:5-formyltetrahydrofolate cyclo-ligase n=1 Tax=Richelia sinica FACHB-800 TaxID=1357546 RepID=A0A975T4J3_9NOST|nr:5-formyltetrahydrofolate cyclo-ligase [Richelia sinica]MBD2663192.1 5-formyltetrahydrofolate cyclo-ligase [Richelia sinica FACHB-800]QXE22071.1 5-formyltetrahydrofolate cyclo-ligase [Richelia sinica FACHB-800]